MPADPLVPDVPSPDVPLVPADPLVPVEPEVPVVPLVPEVPEVPLVPDVPLVPEVPLEPEVPALPSRPAHTPSSVTVMLPLALTVPLIAHIVNVSEPPRLVFILVPEQLL